MALTVDKVKDDEINHYTGKSIANLVADQIKYNEEFIPNPGLVRYEINWQGKGEKLPDPDKIKDYKSGDKRRRLVHLTLNLLPGSLYSQYVPEDTEEKGLLYTALIF
ncbi:MULTISPECIES: hypothetical protein [Niastella]|uniref:Uncharacterized protein n=1 Tax=Niastella soli TaxID=2821487 RepID=A0ABS3YT75_9BACT|nr:hypothetical protein [Niastella soli]MBO9200787.1 hypothetical protein [Niastella soli]